jgi:serine/threonine protein kinase
VVAETGGNMHFPSLAEVLCCAVSSPVVVPVPHCAHLLCCPPSPLPLQVLLEVAASVQHLHNMQLLHCDIKPENVLLKSDNSNLLGFTTKLSDFGLAKLLRDNYYIINRSGSGTVTHLAPELFQVGSKITTAVDTFSFGELAGGIGIALWMKGESMEG